MGMLRLLLAVIVILNHVQFAGGPNPFIYEGFPASTAVEIFFAISGFYMALILNKKYTGVGSTWTFYVSRFTRIYPAYWAIVGGWLTVELLRLFATGQSEALSIWVKEAPTFPWDTRLYLVAMNICIIGQDLALFLHFNTDGTLACGKGNPASGSGFIFDPVWRFCLDPPAWSISLELMFYLLVPLLARRTIGVIAAVATASFIFKLWVLYGWKHNYDPYNYRLFPAELYIFLLGVLAYRCQSSLRLKGWSIRSLEFLVGLYFLVLLVPCLPWFSHLIEVGHLNHVCILLSSIMLPVLFHVFGRAAWDRTLGELSFPVYLSHWLIMRPITVLLVHLHLLWGAGRAVVIVGASILAACLLNRFLIDPIERWREAFYQRRQASSS